MERPVDAEMTVVQTEGTGTETPGTKPARRTKKKREGHHNRTSRKVVLADEQGNPVLKEGKPIYVGDPLAESIGEELRKARMARGLTINKVAEAMGWSRQTVNTYENGHALPPVDKLLQFAELYKVSVERLVRGKETMTLEAALAELPDDLRAGTMMLMHNSGLNEVLLTLLPVAPEKRAQIAEVVKLMTALKEPDLEAVTLLVQRLAPGR